MRIVWVRHLREQLFIKFSIYDPVIGEFTKKDRETYIQEDLFRNVYSLTHHSLKLETTQTLVVVHAYSGILLNNKEGQTAASHNTVTASQKHYVKQRRADVEECTLYDAHCMTHSREDTAWGRGGEGRRESFGKGQRAQGTFWVKVKVMLAVLF